MVLGIDTIYNYSCVWTGCNITLYVSLSSADALRRWQADKMLARIGDSIDINNNAWHCQIAVSLAISRLIWNLNLLLGIVTRKRPGGVLKKKKSTQSCAIFLGCVGSGSVDIVEDRETDNILTILASRFVELS